MSLFSNKQMRIIFIYCVIIILVICGIITARHKQSSSENPADTSSITNEPPKSSDSSGTSDKSGSSNDSSSSNPSIPSDSDRLPPYNSSNQGNGIGGGAIMGNCSIGSRKLPIYCVDLSKKTNLDTSKKYVSISFDAAWGDEDTIKILDILDKYNINEIDMAGQYILSNHFNSYLEHSLKLVSDSFNVEGDGTSVQMFKIPLHLQTDIEGITATNVLSEEKLSTCVCAYPSIDWVTDDCTRYKLQFVNFSFENETINANFRLYNPRQLTEVVCVLDVEAICKA